MSEFPLGTPPQARALSAAQPADLSGLSLGVLVVEAALPQRFADHGAHGDRAGARGVRDPGLDPHRRWRAAAMR
ncbi:MAG: hypothetical protein MZV65_54470 [Chromatiales bacterium]|nr:hypothetical protein [Chromatiales bacterium]